MAETADVLPEVNENLTQAAKNVTGKIPSTPEGMAVAYTSLLLMALVPIFFGSFRSIKHQKLQKVRNLMLGHCFIPGSVLEWLN